MKNYKMNFQKKTLVITKEFAARALNSPNSEEAMIMAQCRNLCPDLKIEYRTRKASSTPNKMKGMTYKKMEEYIMLYDNSEELLNAFHLVKKLSMIQSNKYQYVYSWFTKQFPNYNDLPSFTNGKLYAAVYDPSKSDETLEAAA